jgi:hypothetical protein
MSDDKGKIAEKKDEKDEKKDEKKEKWLSWVAVTTILFAVCATLSTFKGGGYSTRAVLSQSKAANQWAYYQAKDLKSYLHELDKKALERELIRPGADQGAYAEALRADIKAYGDKIAKYDAQKDEIKKQAEDFERVISEAQAHGQAFGMAVIFLQLAILLSSVAALMKVRNLWLAGLGMGAVGVLFFANGFFLFF